MARGLPAAPTALHGTVCVRDLPKSSTPRFPPSAGSRLLFPSCFPARASCRCQPTAHTGASEGTSQEQSLQPLERGLSTRSPERNRVLLPRALPCLPTCSCASPRSATTNVCSALSSQHPAAFPHRQPGRINHSSHQYRCAQHPGAKRSP